MIINVTDRRGPDMSASRPTQRSTGEVVKVAPGSTPAVPLQSRERRESALCSRWLTTRRMGEDAPKRSLQPVRVELGIGSCTRDQPGMSSEREKAPDALPTRPGFAFGD